MKYVGQTGYDRWKSIPAVFSGLLLVILIGSMAGCGTDPPPRDPIEEIKKSGELIILTRNAPTTYYQGREELEGFEFELASAFADYLGVTPRFVVLDSTSEILEAIQRNEGHIAAAGLTRTSERENKYLFGPGYLTVRQQLVCGRQIRTPTSIQELGKRSLTVIADSSYEERLRELRTAYPQLQWNAVYDMETEQIMDRVSQGLVDCTLADSNIVAINRRYYPELRVGFHLTEEESLAWVVAPAFKPLQVKLLHWFAERDQVWLVDQLRERYFGYIEIFDYVDIKVFEKRIRERLPRFEADFREAAEIYGFSWILLAAQAYQESHWDVNARSPTGVRGMMMLTLKTANQLGILDRMDPNESIMGGARYLNLLHGRLPSSITEPDRTWIALAAYNVGYGHVMDARKLAASKGLDPDLWRSLREVLPLLSKRQYYKKLKYGYARGREPVRYVQRIRDFQDILEKIYRQEPAESREVD